MRTVLEPPEGHKSTASKRSTVGGERDVEAQPGGIASAQLAADEDRSRAELLLRETFAHGRLSLDELTTRVAEVHDARTIGQLRATLGDLPGDPWAVAAVSPAAEDQAHTALVLALIAVLVPAPPFVLGVTSAALAVRSLRGGAAVRRGQALAAVAIGSGVALVQAVLLVLWLAGVI